MKMTFRTAAALGVMLLGGLSLGVATAHAGGCGGEHAGDEHGRVYLPASPAVAAAPAGGRCRYTCSMHPNVVSTAPGSCPICHMALTRK